MSDHTQTSASVVLGGSIWKGSDGKWQTNGLDGPGDQFGLTLDKFRVVAGGYLARVSTKVIIAMGGEAEGERPSIASVIKTELMEMGVPAERIIEETKSTTTYQQLKNLVSIARERGLKQASFISNEWHLPRIQAMVECAPDLTFLRKKLWTYYLSAESILLEYELTKWESVVLEARHDSRMTERLVMERRGEEQIRSGIYKFS